MTELVDFFASDAIRPHISAFALGIIRLSVFISFAPFFGPNVTAAVKFPILLALYMPLHPFLVESPYILDLGTFSGLLDFLVIVVKESAIGFIMAFVIGNIFYAALGAGNIIDNQRGASMAQATDPLSGAESTPLGDALFYAMVTLFFTSGAFLNFLNIFYSTYVMWPPSELMPGLLSSNVSVVAADETDFLLEQALLVCAPFVLICLLCDIALGLMNRFAPQLNVFILSMPIKSGICALLIIFYVGPFLDHSQRLFNHIAEVINRLNVIL